MRLSFVATLFICSQALAAPKNEDSRGNGHDSGNDNSMVSNFGSSKALSSCSQCTDVEGATYTTTLVVSSTTVVLRTVTNTAVATDIIPMATTQTQKVIRYKTVISSTDSTITRYTGEKSDRRNKREAKGRENEKNVSSRFSTTTDEIKSCAFTAILSACNNYATTPTVTRTVTSTALARSTSTSTVYLTIRTTLTSGIATVPSITTTTSTTTITISASLTTTLIPYTYAWTKTTYCYPIAIVGQKYNIGSSYSEAFQRCASLCQSDARCKQMSIEYGGAADGTNSFDCHTGDKAGNGWSATQNLQCSLDRRRDGVATPYQRNMDTYDRVVF